MMNQMTDSSDAFVSELLRAANEVARLTVSERARLLQRAAATIRDCRDEIGSPETPADDIGDLEDIVYCLNEAANLVDESTDAEVAETLVEAIGAIQAAQTLLMERPA
ncbi:hypothetical protein, partial [Pseudaminobacter soli (ex Li et al. 2025)]